MKEQLHGAELIDHFAPEDFSRLADHVLNMGSGLVALKAGARGFYLKSAGAERLAGVVPARLSGAGRWDHRELWAPALQAPHIASATGSGDSAIAGLLSGYVRGLPIERAIRCATCCGWQNVQVLDAVSGIRPWEETEALLDASIPSIDPHIHSRGWHWHEDTQVWFGPADSAK